MRLLNNYPKKIHPLILLVLMIVFITSLLFFTPILLFDVKDRETAKIETKTKNEEDECIYLTIDGQKEKIPLEEYIVGVVAAEMPTTFHPEALKAQAIASRTYVLQRTENGQKSIGTTVEDQVYNSLEQRKEKWDKSFAKNEKKVREA